MTHDKQNWQHIIVIKQVSMIDVLFFNYRLYLLKKYFVAHCVVSGWKMLEAFWKEKNPDRQHFNRENMGSAGGTNYKNRGFVFYYL